MAASIAGLALFVASSRLPRAQALTRGDHPLARACRAAGVTYPPPGPRVVVRKAERVLTLYSGQQAVKEYRVGLGGSPARDKERQGDRCTPTGDFYVCTRLERSRFHRFLGISYPAPNDAQRGLKQGLIDRSEHSAILRAHQKRRQPPWNTRLGGAVGLHGGGSGMDWTLGCVAVENGEIEELFAVLPLGTPVRIE